MKGILLVLFSVIVVVSLVSFLRFGDSSEFISNQPQVEVKEFSQTLNYRDFSSQEYEKSRDENKVVALYFTATWCPTCREQELINKLVFEFLEKYDDIIIFRVHILDLETTKEGEKLAEEFGVRLQHSFVVINSTKEVVFSHTGTLVEEDLRNALLSARNDTQNEE